MAGPRFFPTPVPLSLAEIAALVGATIARGDPAAEISGAGPLDAAGNGEIAFLENPAFLGAVATTRASACLCRPEHAGHGPQSLAMLVTAAPQRAFAAVVAKLFPDAVRPWGVYGAAGIAPGAIVHPEARLEADVTVEPGAVIGAGAEIGSGTVVGAGAVVGREVRIGRQSLVGAGATVSFALVGDRVIIHPGVRIGQDGFGYVMGAAGHTKVPQIGRVIIQDDVEIGANTTIDRGSGRDTVIGQGTKIDNGVQIGHNVVVGRHCVIVAQAGISGSTVLGDFVVLGGQVGLADHLRIGTGAQVAGAASVKDDIPANARYAGMPARPIRAFAREQAALKRLARRQGAAGGDEDEVEVS